MTCSVSIDQLMNALAQLKGIPLSKVVRNASRDYAQGAYKATPLAQISKSEYYRAERNGKTWYIHESQMAGRKLRKKKDGETSIRKVRVQKGWSKSTWIGAFRALGLSPKFPSKRLPVAVEHMSTAVQHVNADNPKTIVTTDFRINNFGKESTQPQHEQIAREGFRLAALRITKEYTKLLREAWSK